MAAFGPDVATASQLPEISRCSGRQQKYALLLFAFNVGSSL